MPDGDGCGFELANVAKDDAARPDQLARDDTCGFRGRHRVRMTPETRARIFEPSLQRKTSDSDGLGLAMVFGNRRAVGRRDLRGDGLGSWTRFNIYLPAVKDVASEQAESRRPAMVAHDAETNHIDHRGSETVLLVEDEASLGTFIAGRSLPRIHGPRGSK